MFSDIHQRREQAVLAVHLYRCIGHQRGKLFTRFAVYEHFIIDHPAFVPYLLNQLAALASIGIQAQTERRVAEQLFSVVAQQLAELFVCVNIAPICKTGNRHGQRAGVKCFGKFLLRFLQRNFHIHPLGDVEAAAGHPKENPGLREARLTVRVDPAPLAIVPQHPPSRSEMFLLANAFQVSGHIVVDVFRVNQHLPGLVLHLL